jgi:glucose/arabinose dehydrogenase
MLHRDRFVLRQGVVGRIAASLAVALAVAACGPGAGAADPSTAPPSSGAAATATAGTASPPGSAPATAAPSASVAPSAGGDPPAITLEPVAEGLDGPLDVAWRADDPDTLFIVEQVGRIRIVRDGDLTDRPFLDIAGIVNAGGEQGLLGLAFHPSGDGRFYVYHTALDGSQVVAAYRVDPSDPDRADPDSRTELLVMDDPFGNHNGGGLAFGPDGFLHIATGDGGGGGDPLDSGRDLGSLLAKVLRIDVDGAPAGDARYAIPDDNPFVGEAGVRPEVWLSGLRNPWRIRFDRATGDLWIGDVGQGSIEEIDVARAGVGGLDFGWSVMEGSTCFRAEDCDPEGLTLPVAEYGHDVGCSVTGGTVYRGADQPALSGFYLFSDYCSGTFWAIDAADDGPQEPTVVAESGRSISAIGEDAAGELYATDLGGELLRIVVAGG